MHQIRNFRRAGQELREPGPAVWVAVGVHVLAQKADLPGPRLHQGGGFLQHGPGRTAFFAPAHIGHHAIGAEIVAALHHGHQGFQPGLAGAGGSKAQDGALVGGVGPALSLGRVLQKLG